MKIMVELELELSNGFPFLHEEVAEITDDRSPIKSVSRSIAQPVFYFWPKARGRGFVTVNLVPVIHDVIDAYPALRDASTEASGADQP